MFLIAGLIVAYILCAFITDGNMGLAFILLIGMIIMTTAIELSEDKRKASRKLPTNDTLERQVFNGLQSDWNHHENEGNHYVPEDYVKYMEYNSEAWNCWAKARTKEILITKGYMSKEMDCISSYNAMKMQRVDHTKHEELYKHFNTSYLPLIKHYNDTGEICYSAASLPFEVEKRRNLERSVLSGYEMSPFESNSPNGYWKCSNCGRMNNNYVGTCGCGTSKYIKQQEKKTESEKVINAEYDHFVKLMFQDIENRYGTDKKIFYQKLYDNAIATSGRDEADNKLLAWYNALK